MSKYTPRSSSGQVSTSYSRSKQGVGSDYDEFASLQLDKPNEGELKTSEELKRHMFDDHFEGRPIERAIHILAVGEEVQRLSVIRDLVSLIQADQQGCLQRVIQKVQQALNTASTEFHIETARSFAAILQKKAVSAYVFSQNFLPCIIYHLDNREHVVANAWIDALLTAIELLPLDIVRNNILVIALNKGQISQSVSHRMASCKLLGKLCSRFDAATVKKDILPVVLSLCQDVNESVRANICSQLHLVAKCVPPDVIKSSLVPILVELGRDETVQVRVEATQTVVNTIPYITADILKATIIPLVKKICELAVLAVDDTLVTIAKQFGSICIGLQDVLSPADKVWMVSFYNNLCHFGIPMYSAKRNEFITSQNMDRLNARYIECRQYCAYNFPAMAKFCSSSPELLELLYQTFSDFSTDPYYMVRKTIGASLHEVAKILSPNNKVVKNQVLTLLWDNMEEVLVGVVPNLGRTIDSLILSGALGHDQDGTSFEIGRGLLHCDKTIREKTHNWRLHSAFITQLETIVRFLPSDYIYTHFVSLMFEKMLKARPLPCRVAAARTLLVLLRYNLKMHQRQEIRARLQSDFCLSSSCYRRMLYLRLCSSAREIFSRSYFKEHFFYPLLSRSEDKVPNNRLLLIRQFPALKAMIVIPSEKKYLQTLESCLRSMAMAEKDKDVMAELKVLIYRMDKMETLAENTTSQTPEDVEDRRKYEEEQKLNNVMGRVQIAPSDVRRVQGPSSKDTGKGTGGQSALAPVGGLASAQITSSPKSGSTPVPSPSSSASSHTTGRQRGEKLNSLPASSTSVYKRNTSPSETVAQQQNINQGLTNMTNHSHHPLSTHLMSFERNCTCFPTTSFHSENLRNLNLLALVDTSLLNSQQKLSESLRQKLNEDPRLKMSKSGKRNMVISWLNLETDLKNELYALVKNRRIHGDRNLKEKSKFLSDFRKFNEPTLSKFINEDKDCKETIYSVTGKNVSNCNFFEDRVNFFEMKIKLEDPKLNCSCFEITTNKRKDFEFEVNKKFSYFSKSFEEEFYRDAGVKANDIIGKKFSGIPVHQDKSQVLSPKISSDWSKRRTWAGNENLGDGLQIYRDQGAVKLETITKPKGVAGGKKKSEDISLKNIGIEQRSRSFILTRSFNHTNKVISNPQNAKAFLNKKNEVEKPQPESFRGNTDRFGYRSKVVTQNEKQVVKTKIPVGKIGNGVNFSGSRPSSPNGGKEKVETRPKLSTNGIKKNLDVTARKSMLIQSTVDKNEKRNYRKSVDSARSFSLADSDSQNEMKTNEKVTTPRRKEKDEEKEGMTNVSTVKDTEVTANGNSSKLPVRKPSK